MGRQVRKNSDRISNLPENITETILARLPILDAVRTSILSRNWRYKWTNLPNLVFVSLAVDDDRLMNVIYRILCQHKGPINKFSLSGKSMTKSYLDIDSWISFLSNKGIREIILEFNTGNWSQYKIHSSFFSCVNLWQLSLCGCKLPSPLTAFNGLNDLTCLRLSNVSVNNEGFENLIAKCPNLNALHLTEADGLDRLKIGYAPKLLALVFVGSLESVYIYNTQIYPVQYFLSLNFLT